MKKILMAALVLSITMVAAGCKKKTTPAPQTPEPVSLLKTWKVTDIDKVDDTGTYHALNYYDNQVIRMNETGTYRGLEGLGAYYYDEAGARLLLVENAKKGIWFDIEELKAESLIISCKYGKITFAKHYDDYYTHDDSEDFSEAKVPDKDIWQTSWIAVSEDYDVEASSDEQEEGVIEELSAVISPFLSRVFGFHGSNVFYTTGIKGSVPYTLDYPEFTLENTYEMPVVFVIKKLDKDELVFSFDIFDVLSQEIIDEYFSDIAVAKVTVSCVRFLSLDFWDRFYEINEIN